MTLTHDDSNGFGVEVYWSRKTKYPYKEESEGSFSAPACPRNTFTPFSFTIQVYGEMKFTCDSIYLGVYQYTAPQTKLCLVQSFEHNTSKQALIDAKTQEETLRKIHAEEIELGAGCHCNDKDSLQMEDEQRKQIDKMSAMKAFMAKTRLRINQMVRESGKWTEFRKKIDHIKQRQRDKRKERETE